MYVEKSVQHLVDIELKSYVFKLCIAFNGETTLGFILHLASLCVIQEAGAILHIWQPRHFWLVPGMV